MTKFAVASLWLLGGLSLAAIGAAASVGDATPPTTRLVPVWQLAQAMPGLGAHEVDVDSTGQPHILYTQAEPERLSYAYRTDDGWHSFDVAPVTFSPDFSFDLAVQGPMGSEVGPVVAYTDLARDALFLLTARPDPWTWQQANTAGRLATLFAKEPMMVSVHDQHLVWWIDGSSLPVGEPDPYIWSLSAAAGRPLWPDDTFMVAYTGGSGSHLITLDPAARTWIDTPLPFLNVVSLAVNDERQPVLLVTEAEVIDPGHPPVTKVRLRVAELVAGEWETTPVAEGINWSVQPQLAVRNNYLYIAYRDPEGNPALHLRYPDGTWRWERLDAPTVGEVSLAVNNASEVFIVQSDGESLRVWTRRLETFENVIYLPLALQ